jgi:hypothetical protein
MQTKEGHMKRGPPDGADRAQNWATNKRRLAAVEISIYSANVIAAAAIVAIAGSLGRQAQLGCRAWRLLRKRPLGKIDAVAFPVFKQQKLL